jgi:hypothetical protein
LVIPRVATVRIFTTACLAILLPWTTWYQHGGQSAFAAVRATPLMLFVVTMEALAGLWIAQRDRWLGVFVAYIAILSLRAPLEAYAGAVASYVLFGALIILITREMSKRAAAVTTALLVASGLAQVALVLLQWSGHDPLWAADAPYVKDRQLPGSIGHGNWLGVYLAMIGPLASWWALPLFVLGLVLAQSRLGLIALAAGIAAMWCGRTRREMVAATLAISAGVGITIALLDKTFDTWPARWEIWRLGITLWAQNGPLLGLGPGSWSVYVPSAQEAFSVGQCPPTCFLWAHNDVLQLLFEGGAVAIVILGLWLWDHRRAFTGPYAGSLVAILIGSLGMFPFHIAQVAVPALVIVGLATREEE